MSNLDLFDVTCAKLLAELYDQFPLEIQEFRDDKLGLFNPQSVSDEDNEKRHVVSQSIVFLKQNGYVTYNGWEGHDTGVPKYHMKLTAKGLERLRSTPDGIIDNNNDVGSALIKKVKNLANVGVDETIKSLVKAVITGGA